MKIGPKLNLIHISLALFLATFQASDSLADNSVKFFYATEGADKNPITLTCNGVEQSNKVMPTECSFDTQGKLKIALNAWNQATALLSNAAAIKPAGSCRGSLIGSADPSTFNLSPLCSPNDGGGRQDATGKRLVDEWFADLPWHQKLSTRDSNLIDISFVLAPAAISQDFRSFSR